MNLGKCGDAVTGYYHGKWRSLILRRYTVFAAVVMKLGIWIVGLVLVMLVCTWFWPPMGYGFVVDRWFKEAEPVPAASFQSVSAIRLLECQVEGLEECMDLRTGPLQDVTVKGGEKTCHWGGVKLYHLGGA